MMNITIQHSSPVDYLALADDGEGQGRVAVKLVLKYNVYSVPQYKINPMQT